MSFPIFAGTHLRWNIRDHPSKILPNFRRYIAIHPSLLEQSNHLLHVPVRDTIRPICIVPDRINGSISYGRLCDALYEYYHADTERFEGLGEYTNFGGIVINSTPLTRKTYLLLNVSPHQAASPNF